MIFLTFQELPIYVTKIDVLSKNRWLLFAFLTNCSLYLLLDRSLCSLWTYLLRVTNKSTLH